LAYIPETNLIVIITGTKKIIFLWVKIKGHHMWSMTTICL